MPTADQIQQIFDNYAIVANTLLTQAQGDVTNAFGALASLPLAYDPYQWEVPSAPIIGPLPATSGPAVPGSPKLPTLPTLVQYTTNVPNPAFGTAPIDNTAVPVITFPATPGQAPTDTTGSAPAVSTPNFPSAPGFYALPSAALPYGSITVPDAPTFIDPVFDGVAPDDIQSISLDEYLQKLTDSYTTYSQLMPGLVQSNWLSWFRVMVDENPNIRKIDGIISVYMDNGGAGIPTPIEEAIVTRATDRISAEARRKQNAVWDSMAQRGLTLASGALMSGLKEARGEMAEAVSKVATDVAIQNLTLEHDHMKFMLTLGRELNTMLLNFAGDTAKVVTEINGQAIEMTKTVLTGMIEVNNAIVRIYLAKWEGYKAAVEVFKAKWMAIEVQVRVYEAEIRAELAKTEINKAVVEVLQAMINANQSLVSMYKTQVEAETAKIEADRVRVMAYEATVHAYAAKVEAYRAVWEGYRAGVEGQVAVANVYRAQIEGYVAKVNGYKASVEAYGEQVRGYTAQIQAISTQNETSLKAYSIELEGLLHAYSTSIEAYGRNWSAIGEQLRASANVLGIQSEFLSKQYTVNIQIEIERAREHMAQWRATLEGTLQAANGMTQASQVATSMANSALNGLTSFAGVLATETES